MNERRLTWSFDFPSLILFMARLSRSRYVPPPGVSFSSAFSLSFSSSSSDIVGLPPSQPSPASPSARNSHIRPFTNFLAKSSPDLLSSTSESSDVLAIFEAEDLGREGGRASTRVFCRGRPVLGGWRVLALGGGAGTLVEVLNLSRTSIMFLYN